MDDWVRAVHRAREVLGGRPEVMPVDAGVVRPVVYESWRRSKLQGLEPDRCVPGYHEDVELDSYLTRAVTPLVEKRRAALEQASCSLALTDHEGRMLRRWVPDAAFASRLDALDVAPRFSFPESQVGTTSVIALLKGAPVLVRGPEHFPQAFHTLTCAGAPIVHPVTRRVIGSLDLTCRLTDTSPVLLAWVMELATEIQESLRHSASRRERLLLDSYLAHNRDSRHPLVTLDQSTIIINAAAARLIGTVDQALLWEHASRAVAERATGPRAVVLAGGASVSVETEPVTDGPDVIGVVLKLKEQGEPVQRRQRPIGARPRIRGLVGQSPRWSGLCEQAAQLGDARRVLVVGEPGSGRRAIATALAAAGPVRIVDASDLPSLGIAAWLEDVATELDGPQETLVLAHVDLLSPDQAQAADLALARRPHRQRVFATTEVSASTAVPRSPLLDTFDAVLPVPALRDRTEDLPALVAVLAERVTGPGAAVRWMPETIQVLSRLEWAGNVASLESLVRHVTGRCRAGYVGPGDLPAEVVAQASRRPLAKLEHAEARAILEALRAAGGNKHRAAEALGIARSTLYRKVRALGLDLTTTTY